MSKNPYEDLELEGLVVKTGRGDYIHMVFVRENGKKYLLDPPCPRHKCCTLAVLGEGCDFGVLAYCTSWDDATAQSSKLKKGYSHVQILELEEVEFYF